MAHPQINSQVTGVTVQKDNSRANGSNNNGQRPHQLQEPGERRVVSKLERTWVFGSFLVSAADVLVILYLAYSHFEHSEDLLAWVMLSPILLNFIGIFAFLSNEAERQELDTLACQKRWKHFMTFPVIGPTVSTLRLFIYSFEEDNVDKYERLESLVTKMKQYESFFRAAPEAYIQITFHIVTWTSSTPLVSEDVWSSVCIVLCIFALAESNMYAPVLPAYYRLFNYTAEKDAWNVHQISSSWRVGLFLFNFASFASRLFADAVFRATACFYFEGRIPDAEVIILSFLVQFVGRAVLHAINQSATNHFACVKRRSSSWKLQLADEENSVGVPASQVYAPAPVQEDMTGVYGAFTYAWRSLFMSFDFQHWKSNFVFFWFYLENCILIAVSFAIIGAIEYDVSNRRVFYGYVGLPLGSMLLAIALRYALPYSVQENGDEELTAKEKTTQYVKPAPDSGA